MAGPKINGWDDFELAYDRLDGAQENLIVHKNPETAQLDTIQAIQAISHGLEDALQEMYERMQRLHQKIDRLEAKVGSVPKK